MAQPPPDAALPRPPSAEIELKLAPESAEACDRLRNELLSHRGIERCALTGHHVETQLNVYFDTPSSHLKRERAGLRLRLIAEQPGQAQLTFKQMLSPAQSSPALTRRELSATVPPVTDLAELERERPIPEPLAAAVALARAEPIAPYSALRTTREAFGLVAADGTRLELVLDRIEPFFREPIWEVELELVAGSPATLDEVGRALSAWVGSPSRQTKHARLRALPRTLPVAFALPAIAAEVRVRTQASRSPVQIAVGPSGAHAERFAAELGAYLTNRAIEYILILSDSSDSPPHRTAGFRVRVAALDDAPDDHDDLLVVPSAP